MWFRYRLSDGQFLNGLTSRPDFDPSTEGVQEYLDAVRPDIRLHRFDATTVDKKRLATAQELTAFDTARSDEAALAQFDGPTQKMIKALAIWTAQKLGVPLATAKQEIVTIYKGL
jgi:hypothetical protein